MMILSKSIAPLFPVGLLLAMVYFKEAGNYSIAVSAPYFVLSVLLVLVASLVAPIGERKVRFGGAWGSGLATWASNPGAERLLVIQAWGVSVVACLNSLASAVLEPRFSWGVAGLASAVFIGLVLLTLRLRRVAQPPNEGSRTLRQKIVDRSAFGVLLIAGGALPVTCALVMVAAREASRGWLLSVPLRPPVLALFYMAFSSVLLGSSLYLSLDNPLRRLVSVGGILLAIVTAISGLVEWLLRGDWYVYALSLLVLWGWMGAVAPFWQLLRVEAPLPLAGENRGA